MSDNIIAYVEMCRREGVSLQQGMNFGFNMIQVLNQMEERLTSVGDLQLGV